MNGKYDDIMNLPHHVSDYHKPMPMSARAAQFAPFAALSGHDDAIAETARITERLKELSDDEKYRLSRLLNLALENEEVVVISYFIPDKSKSGGTYKRLEGKIKDRDECDNTLMMTDGTTIPVNFISEIEFKNGTIEF